MNRGPHSRTQITYRCERWRSISAGIIETAGTTFLLLIAVAAAFSEFAGQAFSGRIDRFQVLLLIFAAALALAGVSLRRCPSNVLESASGSNPFRSLRYAWTDEIFRRTLICWMLMGFANLMMIPMRVEMLANRNACLRHRVRHDFPPPQSKSAAGAQ